MNNRMNRTTMKHLVGYAALGLTICLLARPNSVNAKDVVERPLKVRNDLTTVNYKPFPNEAVMEGTGWMTHLGHITAKGELVGYTESGDAIFHGSFTSANGDEVFWDAYVNPGVSYTVMFTGGTGRFEGASGGYKAVYTYRTMDPVSPVPGQNLLVTFGSEGTGTITY